MTVRFIHCSDLHLGAPYSMLPRKTADRRRVDQRQTFARIVDIALAKPNNADLMFITGDLFDSDRPSPRDIAFVRSQLRRLADGEVKTYIIPGNHDPYRNAGFWSKADLPCTKLFTAPAFECCRLEGTQISVCGIAPDPSHLSKDQIASFDAVIPTPISVLLFHGSWLNFGRDSADCHPFSTEELGGLTFNYAALGHYHAYREVDGIPFKAIYPGTPEAIGFSNNDLGDRFVVVGTIDGQGNVNTRPHKINQVAHVSQELDCTTESTQSLRRKVEELLAPSVCARVSLTGMPPAEVVAATDTLADELAEMCIYLNLSTDFGNVGAVPADNTYLKKFVYNMNARIEDAPDAEKPLLSKALELGIRAFMKEE